MPGATSASGGRTGLLVQDLSVRFGGVTALDAVSLAVLPGQICALIGPNGAGKTSLFNCICRMYEPSTGRVVYDGQDVLARRRDQVASLGIARTFQNLAPFTGLTVVENVLVGAGCRRAGRSGRALGGEAMELLESLGLGPVAHQPCVGLPFGTMKRIELVRALAARPSLLLLDEPANGLTQEEVADLVGVIRRVRTEFDVTILLVEHHMGLVMEVSEQIFVLDSGRQIAAGTPQEVSQNQLVIDAYLGTPV